MLLEGSDAGWQLSDQASKNGTYLNGHPVGQTALEQRCWLSIGGVAALIEPEPEAEVEASIRRPERTALASELTRLSDQLQAAQSTEATAERLIEGHLQAVLNVSGCERAGLWRKTGQAIDPVTPAYRLGPDQPPHSLSPIRRVFETGRAIFASDLDGAEQLMQSRSIVAGGIRAVIAMPLTRTASNREPLDTVLYADSTRPGKLFTELDAELLDSIVEQLSLTLATLRVRSGLQALAGDR